MNAELARIFAFLRRSAKTGGGADRFPEPRKSSSKSMVMVCPSK
jgi:hypothetical protein